MFRKTAMVGAMVLGLGLVGIPAFGDDDSDTLDDWYQEACEIMLWQFDGSRTARQNHPNFVSAVAMRDQGAARCEYGDYNEGSVMMRTALQRINVSPLY
jgi:hypothetical protein